MKIFNEKISKNLIFFILGLGVIIFLFVFLITTNQIGSEVKNTCLLAQEKYDKSCVDSLTQLLDDKENEFRDRNRAIWALGQLGDDQALLTLKKYYTGNIPEREPINAGISQYELKKAIALLEGGFNLGDWTWKNGKLFK